jgi:hypothetical protein
MFLKFSKSKHVFPASALPRLCAYIFCSLSRFFMVLWRDVPGNQTAKLALETMETFIQAECRVSVCACCFASLLAAAAAVSRVRMWKTQERTPRREGRVEVASKVKVSVTVTVSDSVQSRF